MLTITFYSRKNDQSSVEARANLESLQEKYPHRLVEVDVDSDPVIQKAFGDHVPSIEVGPYKLNPPFDKQKLMMTIGAANDRRDQFNKLDSEDYQERVRRGQTFTGADRLMFWLSRHYLALLNIVMLFYFGLPILAPVLMNAGLKAPANIIYTIYKPLCHQFGFRSFFLFGEQPYYPLKEANISGVITFDEATGFENLSDPSAYSRLQARQYIGDEVVGYKMALCERDMGIYAAIFLFGIVYAATGRRIKPLHWLLWILIGIGPIGLDGFSQLFSQMQWSWLVSILPYRESTPILRVLTGALFGVATAWFSYPYIEESMMESSQFFIKKNASAMQNKS